VRGEGPRAAGERPPEDSTTRENALRWAPGSQELLGTQLVAAGDEGGLSVIILGVILLVLGLVLDISILWTIGLILVVIGVVLWILGSTGRAIGGRPHWY
jgi:hypothetical protein